MTILDVLGLIFLAIVAFMAWMGYQINKELERKTRERKERKRREAQARENQRNQRARARKEQEDELAIKSTSNDYFKRELMRALKGSNTNRAVELIRILPPWPTSRQIIDVIYGVDDLKRRRTPALESGVSEGLVNNLIGLAGKIEVQICEVSTCILDIARSPDGRDFDRLDADNKSALIDCFEQMRASLDSVGRARARLSHAVTDAQAAKLNAQTNELQSINTGLNRYVNDPGPTHYLESL